MKKNTQGKTSRPKVAAFAAGAMLLSGVGLSNLVSSEAADLTTVSRINCTALGGFIKQDRDLNVTTNAPDSVAPGGTFDLTSRNVVTVPAGQTPPVGTLVKSIKVYITGNAKVATINNVTFSGGNFSGAWARDAAAPELVLTLTSNDPAGTLA